MDRGASDGIDLFGEEEDFCIEEGGTEEDNAFDEIVGALEMVLLDPGFVELQRGFCEAHCSEFEDSDENKLSYTGIFEQYQNTVESYIQKRVGEVIDGFSLEAFGEMLTTRQDEICGDVFDMLMTLGDFAEFKDLMLHYKSELAGSGGGAMAARLDGLLSTQQQQQQQQKGGGLGGGTGAAAAAPESPVGLLSGKMGQATMRDESKWELSP